jgi:hypothetical protein
MLRVGGEPAVARQQMPRFGRGAHRDRCVRTGRTLGIESEHAQPSRQALEHGIGEKARWLAQSHPTRLTAQELINTPLRT